MALPPELEEQFMTDIVAYEEREKKPYVTSVERIASQRGLQLGLEQGLEQGLEIGRREMLLETLEARFDAVPAELVTMIEQIGDPSLLLSLQRLAVLTDSLETFEQEVLARL
jgi:flagellar biosynthesis/type III secretory pathway protein FliH